MVKHGVAPQITLAGLALLAKPAPQTNAPPAEAVVIWAHVARPVSVMTVFAAAEAARSFVVTMVDVSVAAALLTAMLLVHVTVFAAAATTALVSRVQVRIVPVVPVAAHVTVPEVPVPATVQATAAFAA